MHNDETKKGKRPFVRTTLPGKSVHLITQTDAFSTEEGKIALIIGDSGHGKSCLSKTIQRGQQKHDIRAA